MWVHSLVSLTLLLALAGCESDPVAECKGDPACICGEGIDAPPNEGQNHVPDQFLQTYKANPPATGPHWPFWDTTWGNYLSDQPTPLDRERWLHNLEHGGIVLLYNCPQGCPADTAQLVAIKNGRRPDKFGAVRVIVNPDKLMPKKFAAVAWGYRWQGDTIDAATINCFIDARYDKAPESVP
jgi:hypothetical protein